MADEWPSAAGVCDFGIVTEAHLGALQHAARSGATAEDFDAVLGNGEKITQLVRKFPDNPYGNVTFSTPWDALEGRA